jgi:hypothetical protein
VAITNYNGNGNTVLAGNGAWRSFVTSSGNIGNVNLNGNTFTYLNGAGNWANIAVPVVGNVAPLNLNGNVQTVLSGTGTWVPANTGGNITQINLNGNANTVLSGTGSWRAIGNVSDANLNGNINTYLNGNGQWANIPIGVTGASGSNTWIQYNAGGAFGANSLFTYDIPSATMKSANVSANGLMNVQYATENVSLLAAPQVGTYTLDALSRSVHYIMAAATSGLVLAIRGSSSVTLNSLMATGQCITVVFMMTTGATGYVVNTFTIDGTTVVPKWANGVSPAPVTNSISVYTLTITKTSATPTYTIIGNYTGYR